MKVSIIATGIAVALIVPAHAIECQLHARSKGFEAIDLGLGGNDASGIVGEGGSLVRRRGGVEHPKREANQDRSVSSSQFCSWPYYSMSARAAIRRASLKN
jgi:hypothetical protein